VRASWARPLGVPGKALRPRWAAGYQARLHRPGNAVLSKITHPLNIIDFTMGMRRALRRARRLSWGRLNMRPTRTVARTMMLAMGPFPGIGDLVTPG